MTRILKAAGPVVDEEKCVGCGLCEEVCPKDILEMKLRKGRQKGESKWLVVVKDAETCEYCHACERECRNDAIKVGE